MTNSSPENEGEVGDPNGDIDDLRLAVLQQCLTDDSFPVNVDSHDQYRIITALGNGSFGHVEEVEYRSAGRRHTYARKQIRAYPRGQRAGIQKMFTNEIKNILKLQGHPHFVRVVDAYAIEKHFNLVLYPKANEGDLAQFLDEYLHAKDESSNTPKIGKMTEILERAFGCLASGLAHMHQHRIRHKDIKPSNVLIHEGEVLWIDFGHAFDSILLDHSATSGPIGIHTRRYSAPEVISSDRRDSKADIYSLGCVFLEILYAVAFDRVALGPNVLFSANALALNTEIASLESDCAGISTKIGSQRLGPVTELIGLMTTEEAEMRPEANSICCDILSLGSFACSACREQLSTHQEIRLKRLESKQITHDGSTCQVLDTKDTSGKSEAPATSTAMLTNDTVLSVAHADGRRSAADGGKTRHHPTDLNTVKSNMLAKEVVLPIFPSKPLLAHEDQLGTGHNTSLQAAPVSEQQQSDGYTPDYVAHREQDPQTQTLEANGTDAMDVLNYRTATKSPVAVPVAKTTSTVPVITSTEPSHHTTAEENSSDQYYTSPALTKSYSEMETGPTRAPSLQTDSSEESMSEVVNRTKPESHLSTAPSEQTLTTPVESFMPSPVIPMFSPSRYLEDFEPNEPSPLLGPGSSSVLGPRSPLQQWDGHFQCWLRLVWNEQHQRYHRETYDPSQNQWKFFDWPPISRPQPASRQQAGMYGYASIDNPPVQYSAGNVRASESSPQATEYTQARESPDLDFKVHDPSYFREGNVFAIVINEAVGDNIFAYNSPISSDSFEELARSRVRCFVLVSSGRRSEFSFACPISTYNDQATKKQGVNAQEHAIAYSEGHHPTLLEGEQELTKSPICIMMAPSEAPLKQSSRIAFGMKHPIEHNVKIRHIGHVKMADLPNLLGYCRMED